MILQHNFNIFDGFVEVTVPLLVEASDYSIIRAYLCLLSPCFTYYARGLFLMRLRFGSDGQLWQRQPRLHHHRQRRRVLGTPSDPH